MSIYLIGRGIGWVRIGRTQRNPNAKTQMPNGAKPRNFNAKHHLCATNDIGDKLAKHIGNTLSLSRIELAGGRGDKEE